MNEGSKKAVVAAFLANLGIAIVKFVGFAFTASASLLAESIHSVADTSNQGLLFLGGVRSRKAADTEHPFGYGRERYFWAFVVAMVLFLLGGVFAIFEGIDKLRNPHELESPAWAVAIVVVGLALEGFSLRTAAREASTVRGDHSWWEYVRRSKSPELPVVLLEDLGALVGLLLALVGVGLATATGEPRWDAAGSLAIGVLLVVIAGVLAVEMRSLLLGESAGPRDRSRIRSAMESSGHVRRLIHMRTEHLGPDELLVAAKVEFEPDLDGAGLADAIDDAESRVRAAVPIARLIYLEPDLYEEDRARPAADAGVDDGVAPGG